MPPPLVSSPRMIHFHSLPVVKVQQETDDCVSVTFGVDPSLADTFRFVQGQSLTVKRMLLGEEVRRTYSICSSPLENNLSIAIKKVEGGVFSTWANEELKEGDLLEVMPPVGKFYTPLDPAQKKNYVAFVAGSGITPVLSIIKTTLMTEPQSQFTLVYGNKNKNSIIFKEELEALKDRFIDRFRVYHILSRERSDAPLNNGRIDSEKLDLLTSRVIDVLGSDEFFLCGPEQMIFCIRDYMLAKGVPTEKIHFELFTIPGQKGSVSKTEKKVDDAGPKSKVSVKLDGVLFDFDLGEGGESILDAALQEGADLPYACKGGVCTTCKAKLLEGKVKMEVNWGLEQDEIDNGYILTCQSHPITDKVVVDFDSK